MEIGDQVLRQQDWLFHRLAPFYDYLIRRPQADRLRDLLDLPPNGVMVDVGGGTGRRSRGDAAGAQTGKTASHLRF